MTDLLYLIGFCFSALRLKVQDFIEATSPENVVAPSNALPEAKLQQNATQTRKGDVGVRRAPQNLVKNLVGFGHQIPSLQPENNLSEEPMQSSRRENKRAHRLA
jgi:hypothetical protein